MAMETTILGIPLKDKISKMEAVERALSLKLKRRQCEGKRFRDDMVRHVAEENSD